MHVCSGWNTRLHITIVWPALCKQRVGIVQCVPGDYVQRGGEGDGEEREIDRKGCLC